MLYSEPAIGATTSACAVEVMKLAHTKTVLLYASQPMCNLKVHYTAKLEHHLVYVVLS
jgi:hypothetical protein